jgi:F-type H+-transporting ATPase subunit a
MHEEVMWLDYVPGLNSLPHFVSYAILASIILTAVAFIVSRNISLVPGRVQNFVEILAEAMLNLANETIGGHYGKHFFPLIATIFMYILISNFMGLIPGFTSPTSNINMTASMAIPVFLATHLYGFKVHGPGYIKHFMGPMPLLAPLMFRIEIISHLARPLTLSVRLFGNMVAKHKLLVVLGILVPLLIPTAILILGVLVSVVQAFVFALLTTIYLAGAVEEAH